MAKEIKLFSTLPNEGKDIDERIADYLNANPGYEVEELQPCVCDRVDRKENCLLITFKTS